MKAYKATYDFNCKDLTFEIGKTYSFDGKLIICRQGLHFCKNPNDLLRYYPYQSNLKILEIEVQGDIIDKKDKSVTNRLKVTRKISFNEWNDLFDQYEFTKKNNKLEIKRKYSSDYWKKWTYDDKGNEIYFETSDGIWRKSIYDEKGNKIKKIDLYCYWEKFTYDDKGNEIYFEDSDGYWEKFTYDNKGNEIYFEDSFGYWSKFGYDENENLINFQNSNGNKYKINILK